MDVGHGVVTPGEYDPRPRLARLGLPADLSGRTVLDVGAWDGFYSLEAERRGAKRVLATDSFAWSGGNWGSKRGFELARRALESRVEDRQIDVLDLSPSEVGTFDLVLFLGVLYHMRHPLRALERVASVSSGQVVVETHVDMLGLRRPAMAFYPGRELKGDPTSWWGPNSQAVDGLLRMAGFRDVRLVWLERPARRLGRAAYRGLDGRHGPLPARLRAAARAGRQGRAVFHAFR